MILRSPLKPGPIVVWVEGISAPPHQRGSPESDIVGQVSMIRRSEFNYRQVLTIGPKFRTARDRAAIAADFTTAVEHLIKQGEINSNGAFAAGFRALLKDAAAGHATVSS